VILDESHGVRLGIEQKGVILEMTLSVGDIFLENFFQNLNRHEVDRHFRGLSIRIGENSVVREM
jgi:hypothetical protein